jgi:hypothetical protein
MIGLGGNKVIQRVTCRNYKRGRLQNFILSIGLVVLFNLTPLCHAKATEQEYAVKGAYLYNFLLFANWPEEKQTDTIMIGIIGKDPFGNFFSDVEGKPIKSKKTKLVIHRFGPYTKAINLEKCQLLFISSTEKGRVRDILASVQGLPVLTVGDFEGFLTAGGMINLIRFRKTVEKITVRWEINRTPVVRSGLKLSAQLFQSAVKVVEVPPLNE